MQGFCFAFWELACQVLELLRKAHKAKAKLELELTQPHMAQKPMLRGEVGARALRVW